MILIYYQFIYPEGTKIILVSKINQIKPNKITINQQAINGDVCEK